MTTEEESLEYSLRFSRWIGRDYAVFNPHSKPVDELPVIFGFNSGGRQGWYSARLIAQDGTLLGGHVCSEEGYMPGDLGCLEGRRPDRHEDFRRHYPDGYRMEFVGIKYVEGHARLMAAIGLAKDIGVGSYPTIEVEVS